MDRWVYLKVFAGAVIALLLLVTVCAFLVDPYGIFRPGDGERAVLESNIGQIRVYQAVGRGVRSVVLGNSRAEVGFDPRHYLFTSEGAAAHNLAVPGGGVSVSAAQLAALCRIGSVEIAVLGVDFMDFIRPRGRPSLYSPLAPMRHSPSIVQYARSLVSAEAMFDSGRTVLATLSESISRQSPEGLNLMNAYELEARRGGYHQFFEQKFGEYVKRLASAPRELMGSAESSPQALREIVETSRKCRTRLFVISYPYHLQLLALFSEAGLWNSFEQWKRQVTAIVEDADSGIVFIDVARASSVTSEGIPPKGDRVTVPRWYWESGHFKRALGDLVLSSAAGDREATKLLGGVRMTTSNVEGALASDREVLERALQGAPEIRLAVRDAWRRQAH